MKMNVIINGKIAAEGNERPDRAAAMVDAIFMWKKKIKAGEYTGKERVKLVVA